MKYIYYTRMCWIQMDSWRLSKQAPVAANLATAEMSVLKYSKKLNWSLPLRPIVGLDIISFWIQYQHQFIIIDIIIVF